MTPIRPTTGLQHGTALPRSGRVTRSSAAKASSDASSVPSQQTGFHMAVPFGEGVASPPPPPTTSAGKRKAKRASKSDSAEPPAKKVKTTDDDDDEEMDLLGDGEEYWAYGSEEEGLLALYDSGDEEDGDFLEEESKMMPIVLPATKTAGTRRRDRRVFDKLLKYSPEEFRAVNIGHTNGLPDRTEVEKVLSLWEFERRMKHAIAERHSLANLDVPYTPDFPFVFGSRRWWQQKAREEVWELVRTTVTEARRQVLGGMWYGIYKFEDLPAPTAAELRQWLVYGDLVRDLVNGVEKRSFYVGSGTASKRTGFGWARVSHYEKVKRYADRGADVTSDRANSYHLDAALSKTATMDLRVIVVADPDEVSSGDVVMLEGLFVDFMQSLLRGLESGSRHRRLHSEWSMEATMDATVAEDATWIGLNHSSPFMQGFTQDKSPKLDRLEAQGHSCELCGNNASNKPELLNEKNWHSVPVSLKHFECKNTYICVGCVKVMEHRPGITRDELKHRRAAASVAECTHIKAMMDQNVTPEEGAQLLWDQDCKCAICYEEGLIPDDPEWWLHWTVNRFRHVASDAPGFWICKPCSGSHNKKVCSAKQYPAHWRKFLQDNKASRLEAPDNVPDTQLEHWRRYKAERDAKWAGLLRQNHECAICPKTWDFVKSANDLFDIKEKTERPVFIKEGQHGEKALALGLAGAMVCHSCFGWWERSKKLPLAKLRESFAKQKNRRGSG